MDETGKNVNAAVDVGLQREARAIRRARYDYLSRQHDLPLGEDRRSKERRTVKGNSTKAKQYAAAVHGDFPKQHAMSKTLHGSSSKPDWSRAAMTDRVGLAEIGNTGPTLPENATAADHKASMRAANRRYAASAAVRRRSEYAHDVADFPHSRGNGPTSGGVNSVKQGMSRMKKSVIGGALAVGGLAAVYGVHRYRNHNQNK